MQTAPLTGNHATIHTLEQLFFSESKPPRLKPVDLTVLTYLLLRRSLDHEIFDSYQTIAERTCSDRQTVARSLARLQTLKWVSVGGRGTGKSKAIALNIEKLPATQGVRVKPTQEARQLAFRYEIAVKKLGRRKFPKNWLARQVPSAQRILTRCGNDLVLARRMIGYALQHPKYKKRAAMSLYHLLAVWSGVTNTYEQMLKAKHPAPTEQAVEASGGNHDYECNTAA